MSATLPTKTQASASTRQGTRIKIYKYKYLTLYNEKSHTTWYKSVSSKTEQTKQCGAMYLRTSKMLVVINRHLHVTVSYMLQCRL